MKPITVKLRRENGKYLDTVSIPSARYPVSGEPEVFFSENTCAIQDRKAVQIFDSIPFKPGFCFGSAELLCQRLKAAGYDAQLYVGWFFVGMHEYPIHHSWVVVDGSNVLDTTAVILAANQYFAENESRLQGMSFAEKNVKMLESISKQKNSERVIEPGKVPVGVCYIGSQDTCENGKRTNRSLRLKYPMHPSFSRVDEKGRTETQKLFYKEEGL